MDYFDIVFFAIVAVVLILRLRAVLGQRHEDEPQRPNPFAAPSGTRDEDDEDFVVGAKSETFIEQQKPLQPPVLAPESLAGALELLHRRDPSFDEKNFLKGARAAFTMIVSAFAKGDLPSLQSLLGPEVYRAFSSAVAVRQEAGQRLETVIHAIKDAELLRARMEGDVARLTVRFTSQQSNTTYDGDNNLIEGTPGAREEIEDIWTFARNVTQKDLVWHLVETRA